MKLLTVSLESYIYTHIHDLTLIDEGKKFRVSVCAARCKRCSLAGNLYNDFHLLLFGGEVGIEIGLSRLSLGQAPASSSSSSCASCSPFAFHLRHGYREGGQRYRRTETEAVKAAARPAAASVSLHHARDLVLPRASSISGVASPPSPSPSHSPSRWPLLVPSVESGGLRESLETT